MPTSGERHRKAGVGASAFPARWICLEPALNFYFGSGVATLEDGMFVKLTDGMITRWINMDAVIQMRPDEDKHQTELFLLRENAGPVFVDEPPEEIQTLLDMELERLSQIANWSAGGQNGRRR